MSLDEYLVPTQFGEDEFIEKKSRFIGRLWPVETEAEALDGWELELGLSESREGALSRWTSREAGRPDFRDDGVDGASRSACICLPPRCRISPVGCQQSKVGECASLTPNSLSS